MNLMQDGDVWLDDQMQQHAGRDITFSRRGESTGTITAVSVEMQYDSFDEDGFATKITSRDYYIQTADLVINSVVVEPRDGDSITETINGVEQTFELMKLRGKPVAEILGDGMRVKVHTKRVV